MQNIATWIEDHDDDIEGLRNAFEHALGRALVKFRNRYSSHASTTSP